MDIKIIKVKRDDIKKLDDAFLALPNDKKFQALVFMQGMLAAEELRKLETKAVS